MLQVDETLLPFRLSQEQLGLVKARMRAGMEAGLKATGSSAIKMLPSFVFRKPDGSGQMFILSESSVLQVLAHHLQSDANMQKFSIVIKRCSVKIHQSFRCFWSENFIIIHMPTSFGSVRGTGFNLSNLFKQTRFLCFSRTRKISFIGSRRDKLQGISGGS